VKEGSDERNASRSILVVDDSPVNLKLALTLLTKAGYQVRGATDAKDAMRVLDGFMPRLILMDMQMPGTDGFELTRRLKVDPARRQIRIVAVTAYAMKADEQRALAAGCDGYIAKPIDLDTFLNLIAKHLQPGLADMSEIAH
jgi:two-component system, cell cycle response regulator DivK